MSCKRFLPHSFILALAILLAGCTLPDEFNSDLYNTDILWEPGLSAPLIFGDLSIKDLLTEFDSSGFLSEDDSGFLFLAYDTDASLALEDVLPELLDQHFIHVFYSSPVVIPIITLAAPGDTSAPNTQDKSFHFARYGDERLDSIELKAGQAVIDISSTIRNRGILEIHSSDLELNGQPYMQTIEVSDATGTFTDQVTIDLAGAVLRLDNTTDPDTTYMDLQFDFRVINDGNDILPSEVVDIHNRFQNLEFRKAFGYAGSFDSLIIEQSMDFDFLDFDFEGSVSLLNPQLKLDVLNSFGLPFGIKMQDVEGRFADGPPVAINLAPEIDTIIVNAPTLAQIGESISTSVTIDNTNSNLNDLATTELRGLDFTLRALGNPLGTTDNFLLDTSRMSVNLEVLVPLHLKIEDVVLTDTFEFEFPDSIGDTRLETENFESMFIQLETKNGLPLDIDLQVYFMDSLWNDLDSLFDDTNRNILPSGILDPATGRVIARSEGTVNITVDQARLERIWDTKNLILKAFVQTSENSLGEVQYVKFYSEYSLYFKLGAGARISLTLD